MGSLTHSGEPVEHVTESLTHSGDSVEHVMESLTHSGDSMTRSPTLKYGISAEAAYDLGLFELRLGRISET